MSLSLAKGVCQRSRHVSAVRAGLGPHRACFKIPSRQRLANSGSWRSLSTGREAVKPPFKILFAGSDAFSCASLRALMGCDQSLVDELHVLVAGDKRTSRGLKEVHRPLLRTLAEESSLPFHLVPPEGMKGWELPAPFSTESPTNLLVTASFGYLIPSSILSHFSDLNTMNVHPSLLPKYRGAAPIQWTLMNGDFETGVTVQTLSKDRFDEGKILAQSKQNVLKGADYAMLEAQLAQEGARLLVDTLKHLQDRQSSAKIQDPDKASQARKIVSEHAQIDFSRVDAMQVMNRHRGISHQFFLWTTLANGKRVQLISLDICHDFPFDTFTDTPGLAVLLPGRKGQARKVAIPCKKESQSAILVSELKTEGRKQLTAFEWWKGACKGESRIQFGSEDTKAS